MSSLRAVPLSLAAVGSSESAGEWTIGLWLSSFVSSSSQFGKTVLIGDPERALREPDPEPEEVCSVLSVGRELRRLDLRSFRMVGKEGTGPNRAGQLRSSRSTAIVEGEAEGEGGADDE